MVLNQALNPPTLLCIAKNLHRIIYLDTGHTSLNLNIRVSEYDRCGGSFGKEGKYIYTRK